MIRRRGAWKKRYVVLSKCGLGVFPDHTQIKFNAKEDMNFLPKTMISRAPQPQHPYTLSVATPGTSESLLVALASEVDMKSWEATINAAVRDLSMSTRGFLNLQEKGSKKGSRRFVLLHSTAITARKDEGSKVDALITLTHSADIKAVGEDSLEVKSKGKSWILRGEGRRERDSWIRSITAITESIPLAAADFAHIKAIDCVPTCLKSGMVQTRRAGKSIYKPAFLVIADHVYVFEGGHAEKPTFVAVLSPSCVVVESEYSDNVFSLVTEAAVVDVRVADDSASTWISCLRKAISEADGGKANPLRLAAEKVNDVFYDVAYNSNSPLGFTLRRSSQWAVVAATTNDGVQPGSALSAINNEDITLCSYSEVIQRLTDVEVRARSLKLTFRRAAEMKGWLAKRSINKKSRALYWKPKYFVLAEGALTFYNDQDGPVKGVMKLRGAVVSLLRYSETSAYFTFKIGNSFQTLTLQGISHDVMMKWAAVLSYAIAAANGGGFLLKRKFQSAIETASAETAKAPAEAKKASSAVPQEEAAPVPVPVPVPVVELKEKVPVEANMNESAGSAKSEAEAVSAAPTAPPPLTKDGEVVPKHDDQQDDDLSQDSSTESITILDGSGELVRLNFDDDDDVDDGKRNEPGARILGDDSSASYNLSPDPKLYSALTPVSTPRPRSDSDSDFEGDTSFNSMMDVLSDDDDAVELKDEQIASIFNKCDKGTIKGVMSPTTFSQLVRTSAQSSSIFEEMKLFHQFDASGSGGIDEQEWVEGVKKLAKEENGIRTKFYRGLVKFERGGAVML